MGSRSGLSKRTIYLATIVAMIGASAGFVMAGSFTSTTVTESGSWYSVSNSATAAFPTQPTVQFSAAPAGGCTASAPSLGSGGTATLLLPASSSVSTCTQGDFAQEFTLTSAANAAAGTYTFNVYTTYTTTGAPISGAASMTVTIASTLASAGTVNVYVDYGANSPPAGGIAGLNLIVS